MLDVIERAKRAQAKFEKNPSQKKYDNAAYAVAWAVMEPERNKKLSTMAVRTTGLGNIKDKINKNHRKTLGLLRDIKNVKTCGVVSHDKETGITEIARPVGVVGAVVPSTNPVATPVNNVINAIKCGNAIILAPSPKGEKVCKLLIKYIHDEFKKIGEDKNLVQMIPSPPSKKKVTTLMENVDMVVVTGSQNNVRRAYESGTPAIGVGVGNASVIVDETANLKDAAEKITLSKCFDNSTSCSSENAIIVVQKIKDEFLAEIKKQGGILLNEDNAKKLRQSLFQNKVLNRNIIAQDIDKVISESKLNLKDAQGVRFLMIEGRGIGKQFPESGEKLSLVSTLYVAKNFDDAKKIAAQLLNYMGNGHSIGIHTTKKDRPTELGTELHACRVIVNQPHCFATGGAFNNGMPFSLSMGCGTWGKNSIHENLSHKHFLNFTRVVREIPEKKPSVSSVFKQYWEVAGK